MYLHGRNVLREILALPDGRVKVLKVLFTNRRNVDTGLKNLEKAVKRRGWETEEAPPERLFQLCREKKNQGVLVKIKEFPYVALEELQYPAGSKEASTLVVLDRIQDPHNLGAIVRSAAGAGTGGIVIGTHAAAEVTPAVVKVSSGLVFRLPIARVVNIAATLEKLKKSGYWIYASTGRGELLWNVEFAPKTVVVFGNESEGIRRLVGEKCDHRISIPMEAGIDSLNVAAAAAVVLYERKRRLAKIGSG